MCQFKNYAKDESEHKNFTITEFRKTGGKREGFGFVLSFKGVLQRVLLSRTSDWRGNICLVTWNICLVNYVW